MYTRYLYNLTNALFKKRSINTEYFNYYISSTFGVILDYIDIYLSTFSENTTYVTIENAKNITINTLTGENLVINSVIIFFVNSFYSNSTVMIKNLYFYNTTFYNTIIFDYTSSI